MKKLLLVLVVLMATGAALFAAPRSQPGTSTPAPAYSGGKIAITDAVLNDLGLVRSGNTYRFKETKSITVEVFDRGLDGGRTAPENNFYTDWIKAGMLRDHNINVTFQQVSRWTEDSEINNLLAGGSAPDVCVTYNIAAIQSYAAMGGVTDLNAYINGYADLFPNIWEWLKDELVNFDLDPKTNQLWNLEARSAGGGLGNLALIRQDWLKKLNLPEPRSIEEFHRMLVAFRDNAQLLLGRDANQMIPFLLNQDASWFTRSLIVSFIPSNTTDRDWFIYGFDDRHLGRPSTVRGETAVKSAMRIVNQWYNENLVWKDFYLYPDGDATQENMMKAGFVGTYMSNWDFTYRNGAGSISAAMHANASPDAEYIAINAFPNDSGKAWGVGGPPVDRKVFFPSSNKEPIASLLYLDWLHQTDNLYFLQFGEKGVTHNVLADGAIQTISATGPKIMNSPNNIDYTTLINGMRLPADILNKSRTLTYPEVDPAIVIKAINEAELNNKVFGHANVGILASEDGMTTVLKAKRDAIYAKAITAPVAQFDSVFDAGYRDWLSSGGQAIIDERTAKWKEYYGDRTSVGQ
jgi:putative aldouronate transport system substrate-binding protein